MRSFYALIEKIKGLLIKHREIISYLFFGGLTTVVSFATYYALLFLKAHYIVAQIFSWVFAVIFAFVVNKIFVFKDKDVTREGLFRQVWQFVSVRIGSGVIETALLWLLVDVVSVKEVIAKIPVTVLTVVINYIASKLLIFKKKDAE